MLHIHCSGSPHEIGYKHGSEAQGQIKNCIAFYATQFLESAKMTWDEVRQVASTFKSAIQQKWPRYLEEMSGIARGAQVDLLDIVAVNVRTEITFGRFSDGCTALAWRTTEASFLAQNWDWMNEQKPNLICLTIEQVDTPTIKMVTEAGLIGKIGLNSAGVGVCLNAIRAKGMDANRMPCHLGLRLILESTSRQAAIAKLQQYGVASSCHMLVADESGSTGLEWSSIDVQMLDTDEKHRIFHTNHYLANHAGVQDSQWLKDSTFRMQRIEELCEQLPNNPSRAQISGAFEDEKNFPAAICRTQLGPCHSATLFNIVMDLKDKTATVKLGQPSQPEEIIDLRF